VSFAAYATTQTTTAAVTLVPVTFPTVTTASASYSATTSTFTVPTTGDYTFAASLNFTVAAAGTATINIIAGSTSIASESVVAGAAGTYTVSIPVALIIGITAGTLVNVSFLSTTAATINVSGFSKFTGLQTQ
jgi:hypothetical protein